MSQAIMLVGSPASGKSTVFNEMSADYFCLSRDQEGGKVTSLLPKFKSHLTAGNSVVLDNTFPTAESRKPFIDVAKECGVPIRCLFMGTTTEDCSINALHRMWDRHGKLFLAPEDLKGIEDPNMFSIGAIFRYKNDFEKPTTAEGFASIEKVPFKRRPLEDHNHSALILDYDDTLRTVTSDAKFKFPTTPDEIKILPGRTKKLKQYDGNSYLLGVSNQSGIARGQVTRENVETCFKATNKGLGVNIEYSYCPHNVPPKCYCRKPQSGLGVMWIRKYKLDPAKTIYVGDQTTDKTFAKRLGFEYHDAKDFFK